MLKPLVSFCAIMFGGCNTLFVEPFNVNRRGWKEGETWKRHIRVSNGKYILKFKNSDCTRLCASYSDKTWHENLPTAYRIESYMHIRPSSIPQAKPDSSLSKGTYSKSIPDHETPWIMLTKRVEDSILSKPDRKVCLVEPDENWGITNLIELAVAQLPWEQGALFCGMCLECDSFNYEFWFFNTGKVKVVEVAKQKKSMITIDECTESFLPADTVYCAIAINDGNFTLTVNGNQITTGTFDCKSWNSIVPITGRFTQTEVDYLKIVKN